MARKPKSRRPAAAQTRTPKRTQKAGLRPLVWVRRWVLRLLALGAAAVILLVVAMSVIDPPRTFYMGQESRRLGGIDHAWIPINEVAPVMARSVVAAEDANFCQHWGFDMTAIRAALEEGSGRGASTLTQQVVKNVFLWQGRSWFRKALEAAITPVVELIWSKRRIVEVYLNIAEFDEGVFGIDAAAHHYYGVAPGALTPAQAARLAMVLPNPKQRNAANPTAAQRKRAAQILDGAATIRRDGRAACFED